MLFRSDKAKIKVEAEKEALRIAKELEDKAKKVAPKKVAPKKVAPKKAKK